MVERRIREGNTQAETKAEGAKFRLVKVTEKSIRVKRERSKKDEYIQKADFIDIWEALNGGEYASTGYKQSDLQEGNKRHSSAVSFALAAKLPYVRWKKVDRAWTLCLAD